MTIKIEFECSERAYRALLLIVANWMKHWNVARLTTLEVICEDKD